MKYKPKTIEKKWQKKWQEGGLFQTKDKSEKTKKYLLVEFPYPSGDGLHVGHVRSYTALDVMARQQRMAGFNVLYPMGWDAFGLPTENYAIKTGLHPREVTDQNIKVFKKQMTSLGLSFDWSREIDTTSPSYYKWTQWIFLQFFKKGLAYQQEMPINWCPICKIGLANEEVVNGKCERCGALAEQKSIKQWMLKITAYADRLIEDLKEVNYLDKIKTQQINWIGKSHGSVIYFSLPDQGKKIEVFTTRPDTLFGVTALVVAPEHPLVEGVITSEQKEAVEKYKVETKKKSEFERTQLEKEKTGVFTGGYCINPANGQKVPIWIGDYVVASYGGGAVMVVPAHDKRDYAFAKKFDLEIKEVISGGDISKEAYAEYGKLINSGEFDGLSSKEAIEKITNWLEEKESGHKTTQYKLRDWVFSRQHYWGEPIPIIHCEKCGPVAVEEKDLPVELPYLEKYKPSDDGQSPLVQAKDWLEVDCPKCGQRSQRETDTMPNWAGSSWYFLRYIDPKNKEALAAEDKLKYWLPVDLYNGGMEHTTLHLLYSRFWHKFLYDLKVVPTKEPYQRRVSHGMVLGENGEKMSKSRGNVVNPDQAVESHGADTLRLYEMFMGPFDQAISWSEKGLEGCWRFLNKVWQIFDTQDRIGQEDKEATIKLNQLIKKVSEDIEGMKFNTAVAAFMEFINFWSSQKSLSEEQANKFLRLIAPLIPHLAEELWQKMGYKKSIFEENWPQYDKDLIEKDAFDLIIQINGKVRDKMEIKRELPEEEVKEKALSQTKIQEWLKGKEVKKVIYIPGRLINIVV